MGRICAFDLVAVEDPLNFKTAEVVLWAMGASGRDRGEADRCGRYAADGGGI